MIQILVSNQKEISILAVATAQRKCNFDAIFENVPFKRLPLIDQNWLATSFQVAEIKEALKSMHPTKAPAPEHNFFNHNGICFAG